MKNDVSAMKSHGAMVASSPSPPASSTMAIQAVPVTAAATTTSSSSMATFMFRDQVNTLTNWFRGWSECEQTVTLCTLLKILTPTQAQFLTQVLQQSVADCTELQQRQNQANNPAFIQSLLNETKHEAVVQLLAHLPLLAPGNLEAKAAYLRLIPCILAHSIEHYCHLEESRQLLSYSLIHPAINKEERSQFTLWLSHIEEQTYQFSQQQNSSYVPSSSTSDLAQNGSCSAVATSSGLTPMPPNTSTGWSVGSNEAPAGTRDSGISLASPEASTPNIHLLSSLALTSGRPITSCSTNGTAAVVNGEHLPLHATHSGPPSFATSLHQQGHRKLTRSSSTTPPVTPHMTSSGPLPSQSVQAPNMGSSHVSDWLNAHHEQMVRSASLGSNTRTSPHFTIQSNGTSEPYSGLSHPQQQQHHHPGSQPHAPLSPQSSITSSSSDGMGGGMNNQDSSLQPQVKNTFLEDSSGMKDVPAWLKSLRLHKYSYLFQQMTYEEMMGLTEEWLESQMVTKGARHKIVISVNKLRDRQNVLKSLEKEVVETVNLKQPLLEIKNMLSTPLKAFTPSSSVAAKSQGEHLKIGNNKTGSGSGVDSNDNKMVSPPTSTVNSGSGTETGDCIPEGDLPGQICRVLTKLCAQLLVLRPEDESGTIFVQLLDKCISHEAFTQKQKNLMMSWKEQIRKIWHQPNKLMLMDKQRRVYGNAFPLSNLAPRRAVRGVPMKPQAPQWSFKTPPPQLSTLPPNAQHMTVALQGSVPLGRNNTINMAATANGAGYNSRPHLLELKQQVQRTHSAPSDFGLSIAPRPVEQRDSEPEINARLDSLCLSMTEHALGGFDSPDKGSTF